MWAVSVTMRGLGSWKRNYTPQSLITCSLMCQEHHNTPHTHPTPHTYPQYPLEDGTWKKIGHDGCLTQHSAQVNSIILSPDHLWHSLILLTLFLTSCATTHKTKAKDLLGGGLNPSEWNNPSTRRSQSDVGHPRLKTPAQTSREPAAGFLQLGSRLEDVGRGTRPLWSRCTVQYCWVTRLWHPGIENQRQQHTLFL